MGSRRRGEELTQELPKLVHFVDNRKQDAYARMKVLPVYDVYLWSWIAHYCQKRAVGTNSPFSMWISIRIIIVPLILSHSCHHSRWHVNQVYLIPNYRLRSHPNINTSNPTLITSSHPWLARYRITLMNVSRNFIPSIMTQFTINFSTTILYPQHLHIDYPNLLYHPTLHHRTTNRTIAILLQQLITCHQ